PAPINSQPNFRISLSSLARLKTIPPLRIRNPQPNMAMWEWVCRMFRYSKTGTSQIWKDRIRSPRTDATKKNPNAQLTQVRLNFRGSEERKGFILATGAFMDQAFN